MKKRYLAIIILLILVGMSKGQAMAIDDCKVIASFKLNSSLDEEKFICKGEKFGDSDDSIYYSGDGSIKLNNFNAYYFSNYDSEVTLKISGTNTVSMLHLTDKKVKVEGTGSLKFRENSYAKKITGGEVIYSFAYDNDLILSKDKSVYEGNISEFQSDYDSLKEYNDLPDEFNLEDFSLLKVNDYTKMTPISVTKKWVSSHVKTSLNVEIENGFGVIKYVKEEEKTETKSTSKLESENVILISDDEVSSEYTLNVSDLSNDEIVQSINDSLEDLNIISLYDLNVYDGTKIVSMENGNYTIKIKVDSDIELEKNYKIIYVNDNNEVEEYFDCYLDDGYIVFETTHLSQYAIVEESNVNATALEAKDFKFNYGMLFKIALLVSFVAIAADTVLTLVNKSNLWKKSKKKKLKKA